MTSQLNVDTIVDKAGSGGTNVKIGNTSTYVGEGGSGSQNTVQGLCKVWYSFDLQSSQNSFEGSFNCSTGTDNNGGDCTITFTNAMSSQDYTPVNSSADSDITHTQADRTDGNASRGTTTFKTRVRDNTGTLRDGIHYVALFGDLA